jgi:hypothetical protein
MIFTYQHRDDQRFGVVVGARDEFSAWDALNRLSGHAADWDLCERGVADQTSLFRTEGDLLIDADTSEVYDASELKPCEHCREWVRWSERRLDWTHATATACALALGAER